MLNKLIKCIKNPYKIFSFLAFKGYLSYIPDKAYLKLFYRGITGKKLNLKNPKTFNEKQQWLKLYNRKPEYTTMVDKYEVRKYIADKIGEEYLIPLLGVWDSPDEIDFDKLPDRFVLKCNHNSGTGMIICKDKSKLDIEATKKELSKGLKEDYFSLTREWPYKNVKRRIIAEQYMEDDKTSDLRDYKFFCFDGKVRALYIATDRFNESKQTGYDFFDADYNHLDLTSRYPNAETLPDKPQNFEKMKELAAQLSAGIPHIRVDFYEVNDQIYFGELTFYHSSGAKSFEPVKWEYIFGDWIKLPDK